MAKKNKKTPRSFKRFTKSTPKFTEIKGKRFEIKTTASRFKKDSEKLLQDVLKRAKRETQKYTAKQIKVNIKSDIIPNAKLDKDFREIADRSFQTKARVVKNDLDADMADLEGSIYGYIDGYAPKGSIVVSISIVNYII